MLEAVLDLTDRIRTQFKFDPKAKPSGGANDPSVLSNLPPKK